MAQAVTKGLAGWEVDPDYPLRKRVTLVALHTGLWAAVVALGIWISDVGMVEAVWAGYAGTMFWWGFSGPKTAGPFGLKLRRVGGNHAERVENLAAGLAKTNGLPVPTVYLVSDPAPNALVFRKWGPAIGVTRSLLDTYSRTELETVVAHCLVRLNSRHHRLALLAAFWGWIGARLGPTVGTDDDVKAAAMTRYPPGLVRALEKAEPAAKRYAPLWFVAGGPSHRPVPERIAALQDL